MILAHLILHPLDLDVMPEAVVDYDVTRGEDGVSIEVDDCPVSDVKPVDVVATAATHLDRKQGAVGRQRL